MKINIITPVWPPYAGGIGNVAFHNARQLAEMGHQVEVYTPNYESQGTLEKTENNIKVISLKPLIKYGNAAFTPSLLKIFKDGDLIHLHYPFFGGAEAIWFLKKRKKVKLVLHYHMDVIGQGWLRPFFYFYRQIFLPKIIKAADRVIVTSFDYAKNSDIKKYLLLYPEKFREVPNGVQTDFFVPGPKPSNLIELYSLHQKKVILFVGGLDKAHYFKGLEYLLMVMKSLLPNVYLLIIGEGDLKPYYQKQAIFYQVNSRIKFTGKISTNELPKYYNLADVVVLPSIDKSEAFGLVLIEAMACGQPVIASNLAGVRSVIDDGKNGYLAKPKDYNDLAEKIDKILSNSVLSSSMGRAGRAKTVNLYDWELLGTKIFKIYNEIIN